MKAKKEHEPGLDDLIGRVIIAGVFAGLIGPMTWALLAYTYGHRIPRGAALLAVRVGDVLTWFDGRIEKA